MATEFENDEGGGVRSPRYPSVSLETAVEKVKAIYDADKTAGSPVEAAVRHMGYKGRSGPATKVIAALKRYGLAEVRNGRVYPTERAIRILRLSADDDRRKSALKEAALSPEIYMELVKKYRQSGLPSASSLESELVLDGRFNHNAVPSFVTDFLDSLKFAGLTDLGAVSSHEGDDDLENDAENKQPQIKPRESKRTVLTGIKEDVFSLDEGSVVLQWPERLSADSAQDLKDWLALIGRKIERATTAQQKAAEDELDADEAAVE
jgi:hypothetical protein